jgi:hypothetical protein
LNSSIQADFVSYFFTAHSKVFSATNSVIRSARRITTLAREVAETVVAVADVVANLVDGDFDQARTKSIKIIDYNGGKAEIDLAEQLGISSATGAITCTECFALATVQIRLGLIVEDYNLRYAIATLDGDAAFNLDMDASFTLKEEKEWSKVSSKTGYAVLFIPHHYTTNQQLARHTPTSSKWGGWGGL